MISEEIFVSASEKMRVNDKYKINSNKLNYHSVLNGQYIYLKRIFMIEIIRLKAGKYKVAEPSLSFYLRRRLRERYTKTPISDDLDVNSNKGILKSSTDKNPNMPPCMKR